MQFQVRAFENQEDPREVEFKAFQRENVLQKWFLQNTNPNHRYVRQNALQRGEGREIVLDTDQRNGKS
jgi:hypothetical protein